MENKTIEVKSMDWIHIKDEKPEEGKPVLIVCPGGLINHGKEYGEDHIMVGELATGEDSFFYTESNSVENVEYWMPLPLLPKFKNRKI